MEQNNFSIKHWAEDDKPREKLMLKGKAALSDAELVAILIGSGSRNESAVQLSKRILASVDNNLNAIGKLSLKQLIEFKGIGEAKAITIIAAMELGRRRRAEETAASRLEDCRTNQQPLQRVERKATKYHGESRYRKRPSGC